MSASLLEVYARPDDAGTTLIVAGELDLTSLPILVTAIDDAFATDVDQLTIDTRQLVFADSSAIKALVHARAAAEERGVGLRLANVSGSLERTLELAAIQDEFTIVDT